jgi:hypothetical protein
MTRDRRTMILSLTLDFGVTSGQAPASGCAAVERSRHDGTVNANVDEQAEDTHAAVERMAKVFKALADPVRVRLVTLGERR